MTERTRRLFLKELEKRFDSVDRPSERITPTLKAVEELWGRHPDMRLGQLLWWIAGRDPFYMEEYELIDNITKLIKEHEHGDCCKEH